MKNLTDLPNIADRKVLLRADFDVPLEDGQIQDPTRIEASLPSTRFLLEKKAKIVLLAHLGRPKGKEEKYSLRPIAAALEKILNKKVNFLAELGSGNFGELSLLENLRFWSEEEANDEGFAKNLAEMGDFFVNDAFAVCHRRHASMVGIPKFLPSFAGKHLEKELEELTKILKSPERPLVAVIGGAKIETKMPAINNLAKIADKVLVGGRLMFEINEEIEKNVIVAGDHIDTKDIGQESIRIFKEEIAKAKMIVWNGPMGIFEDEKYALGTEEVAKAIVNSNNYSIVGGGDTIAALNKFDLLDKIDYVSTGGGAMLEMLSGKALPGIEALENSNL